MRISNAFSSALAGIALFAAASSAIAQWQVGAFTGEITDSNERYTITVSCESPSVCEYAFARPRPGPAKAKRHRIEYAEVIDVDIPNKNLRATRDAVRADPRAYADARDGPLLRELRPLLESAALYSQCVGEPATKTPWGRICKLDSEGANLPAALLLAPTQDANCRGQYFCAYYVFPLRRVKGN